MARDVDETMGKKRPLVSNSSHSADIIGGLVVEG
jgi:hypothetical protein